MTEEKIIDGTGCVFYNNGKCNNPNGMACNCNNNAVCYYKELKRLEQENKEIYENGQIEITKLCNEKTKYRSALEEINLILDELKQQYDYMADYSEIKEIQDKINEVLQ